MLAKAFFKYSRSISRFQCANFSDRSSPAYQESVRTPIAQVPGISKPRRVTLIPGSGIGPECVRSVQKIFEAAFCPIEWDVISDFKINDATSLEQLRKNECILLGTLPHKEGSKYLNNEAIYKQLDLYTNLTYARSLPGVNTRHKRVDIAVLRENTEGEYSNIEHEVYPGVVESIKVTTQKGSRRIAEYAFEFAYLSGRKKVTAVHKANIMKICDGMFLESTRAVAAKYPFIKYEEMIIDNCCMQIVKNPWQFDVMLMPNLYGSIVSNAVAGICGGPALTCGANIGTDHVIFEQGTRHTGVDIAGAGTANPTAYILSSIIMLKHMDLPLFAKIIEKALDKTFKEGKIKTPDLGGKNTTDEFTSEVIRNLEKLR